MGLRGPKPKPTALRVLDGNPSRRPINADEPRPIGEAAIPPFVTPDARDVWCTVVASMPPGFFAAADEPVLAAFAEAAADHARATAALRQSPALVMPNGKPNPLLRIKGDAARLLATLGTRLGLTPADRSGIKCHSANDGNRWTALIASSRSSKT